MTSTDSITNNIDSTVSNKPAVVSLKCGLCGKNKSRKGCTKNLCIKCCSDDSCLVHKEQRQQAKFREQVMSGTTPIQLEAKEKRSKVVNPTSTVAKHKHAFLFREKGFGYLGDTVIVWRLKEYLNNSKWKEDALRKSSKRKQQFQHQESSATTSCNKKGTSRRKRCRQVLENLYQQSLKNTSTNDSNDKQE